MTHYRAQPEDDAVLIVLCAVRDGQFGKSALNEVIDLWVAGQIGRTDSTLKARIGALEIIAGANENTMRQWEGEAKRLRHQLAGAVSREHAAQAIGWLSAEVAVHGAPSLGPEWLELWDRALTATRGAVAR
jgi:hypothetical protein